MSGINQDHNNLHNDHDFGQLLPHDILYGDPSPTLDPSLFALAAQVQAVAHAQAQGIDINFNIDPTFIDPNFPLPLPLPHDQNGLISITNGNVGFGTELGGNQMIDPNLYEIAQVVEDVNKGKIKLDHLTATPALPQHPNPSMNANLQNVMSQQQLQPSDIASNGQIQNHHQHNLEGATDGVLDVEIDPTLREIVNSLTNAQQSSHANVNGPGLSQLQAAAAIGAHLTDAEERERLQQSLQTTLEDLSQGNYSHLFPSNFPQSPSHNFMNLTHDAGLVNDPSQAGPSIQFHNTSSTQPREEYASKRGRGRPKGSKNKHKAPSVPRARAPKPPGPPSRPKGRPPKERDPEEQADYELRKHERSLGIQRRKGRPRKFPGYLVREMRLKKNRKEFNELLRNHRDNEVNEEQDDEDADDDDAEEEDDEGQTQLNNDQQVHAVQQQNQIQNQNQYISNDLEGIEKVQAEMRMMMDVENMTNGLHQALQVNNHNDPNQDQHIQMNGNHQQHQHQHDDHENDFANWSVQDGQSLLDVVGGVNDHTMEGVFGLSH